MPKDKGLSQEQVADFVYISQSSYARTENGNSNSIDSFCVLFGIMPEELLKQDTIIINQNQQGGTLNNAYNINQLSDKLIEQYEIRIKEKDALIEYLQKEIALLKR